MDIAIRKSRNINNCFLIIDKVYGYEGGWGGNYALWMTWQEGTCWGVGRGILTEKALRKTRHWMMPSMVSPARQKVPVRWRPLRPTAEAVTQAPGGALNKRSRESIAKHTSSPRHDHSRTSLSHCLSVYYICFIFTNHYLRSIVTSTTLSYISLFCMVTIVFSIYH